MLQHSLPQATSLLTLDRHLTEEQALAISHTFRTEPDVVRRMTLTDVPTSLHCMIAYHPIHTCRNCKSDNDHTSAVRRNQLFGWRITCVICGFSLLSGDSLDDTSPFQQYWQKALDAEKWIQAEAMNESLPWTHLADLARLLMMRRDPRNLRPEEIIGPPRVLGIVVPEFDTSVLHGGKPLPSAARPILSLHFRPALLAGITIVESQGAAMLDMLSQRTIGGNRARFSKLVAQILIRNPMF